MMWKLVLVVITVTVLRSALAGRDQCNGPNERWVNCPTCSGKTCKDIGKIYHCPRQPVNQDISKCKGQCECIPGYYRNLIGQCISKENCLKCPGQHEYFTCGNGCDNICKTLPYQNQTNCHPRKRCTEMCYCKRGFARNSYKVCVPIAKCEPPCSPDEDYAENAPLCPTDSCYDSTKRLSACGLDQLSTSCQNACVCKPGLFRIYDSECVPLEQCPQPDCPEGEILSNCPPADSCDGECCPSSRDDPQSCPEPKVCGRKQCVCGFNRHRDRITGKCIPTKDCPPFECNGPNEKYVPCPPICPGEKCADYIHNRKCPKFKILIVIPCKPQCRCKKDHYRDCNGVCVPKCQCSHKSYPPHSKPVDSPGDKSVSTDPEADRQALAVANDKFTSSFFYEVVKEQPGDNIISSPFSVLFPLALLCLYSEGESRTQLENALNLYSDDQIRSAIRAMIDHIESQEQVDLSVAFKTFINDDYPLSDAFLYDAATYLDSEAQNVNFSNKVEAAKIINDWVAKKTHDKIKDIIPPDVLSAATRLVLANAIYFLGNWTHQFDEKLTEKRSFHVNANTVVQKDTMTQVGNFQYGESAALGAQLLNLPYKGGNMSLVILLPDDLDGLEQLIFKLKDNTLLTKAIGEMYTQKVKMYIPKFEYETKINLKSILQKMGISKIFTTNSGLKGIQKNKEALYVSDALQKAFVKVNEKGTEAAAANVVIVGTTSAGPLPVIKLFDAKHPFAFIITLNGSPLFVGANVK